MNRKISPITAAAGLVCYSRFACAASKLIGSIRASGRPLCRLGVVRAGESRSRDTSVC